MEIKLPLGITQEGKSIDTVEVRTEITGLVRRLARTTLSTPATRHQIRRKVLQYFLTSIGGNTKYTEGLLLSLPFPDTDVILFNVFREASARDGSYQPFRVERDCAQCKSKQKFTIDWDQLEVIDPAATQWKDGLFAFSLPKGLVNTKNNRLCKDGFLKVMSLKDLETAMKEQLQRPGQLDWGKATWQKILSAISMLDGFEPGELDFSDLDRMDVQDLNYLEELIDEQQLGIRPLQLPCGNCGAEVRVEPVWENDFLLRV